MTSFITAQFGMLPNSRMAQVMYKGYGGIEAANHKIKFAETKNLKFDLNLAEISSRFGCKTKMGKDFIAFYLDKVISSKDQNHTITGRQQMIKMLVDHPELLEKFEQLLEQMMPYEAIVSEFMQKRKVLVFDSPFTVMDTLNKMSPYLATWSLASTAGSMISAPFLYLPEKVKKTYNSYGDMYRASGALLAGLTISNAKSLSSALYNASGQELYTHGAVAFGLTASLALAIFNNGYFSQELGWAMYSTAQSAFSLYIHYSEALAARRALYAMNQLIHTAKEVETVCEQFNIEHQFKLSAVRSRAGKSLLEELSKDRYQEMDSYFFLTPWVQSFVYEVYEHDNVFAPVYASIAEMDAYVAIASKMVELQNTDHRYCFAQFLDIEQPTIQAQGFWNVLVPTDKVVTNNIAEHRNIILTGSNEGGKTTVIRAILQNIVLAQTFGIAAATEFKLTHFDVIHSFLNVSDDILNGKSRFASELKQAQDILARIQDLQSGEKFFFAFDELFTGTNGEDGAQCAYQFINNIASYKGIQFIYATHFNALKTIGNHNPACANYKIEPPLRNKQGKFIRDEKGQLIYPYKLSPGANDVNVAMDRARDAGIFA